MTVIREAALRDQYEKLGLDQTSKQPLSNMSRSARGSTTVATKNTVSTSATVKSPLVESVSSGESSADVELQKKTTDDDVKVSSLGTHKPTGGLKVLMYYLESKLLS